MIRSNRLTRDEAAAGRGAASWRAWADRLRRVGKPARIATQTAVAALAAFGLFKVAGLPQASWGVITALFVIQPNIGGTISSALGRIAGTVLGTGLGLAWVVAFGTSARANALGLLVVTAILGFVIGLRPGLRFGLVPAAIILLGPAGQAIEKAWSEAVAIGIGAVVGTVVGLIVLPEPAHRAVERHLGTALDRCADLLSAIIVSLLGEPDPDRIHAINQEIETELWVAGGIAAQSRYPSRVRRSPRHPRPRHLLEAVERLWHSLLLMARADEAPLPEAARRELAPELQGMAALGGAYLGKLGEAVAGNAPPPEPRSVSEQARALEAALNRLRQQGATRPLASPEVERIFTLAFAVRELSRNLGEVAGVFSGPSASQRRR